MSTILIGSFFGRAKTPPHCAAFYKFVDQYKKSQPDLELSGYGGELLNRIDSIALNFNSQDSPTPEEALSTLRKVANDLTLKVNESNELKPYLRKYPFSQDELCICIAFTDELGKVSSIALQGDHVRVSMLEETQVKILHYARVRMSDHTPIEKQYLTKTTYQPSHLLPPPKSTSKPNVPHPQPATQINSNRN